MSYNSDPIIAGRNIIVKIYINGNSGSVRIKHFKHRSWNHLCWSYDSISGENRIFVNGKFQGKTFFDSKIEALGSNEVYGSSFSIGQEPDAFRGEYDAGQAFRGNISEINLWDYVLPDKNVEAVSEKAAAKAELQTLFSQQ